MKPIPLPSHVHYELLLQLLERKSIVAAYDNPILREQIRQLIISLRKALAQQKHLENICQQTRVPIDYHWSLNSVDVELEPLCDRPSTPSAIPEQS